MRKARSSRSWRASTTSTAATTGSFPARSGSHWTRGRRAVTRSPACSHINGPRRIPTSATPHPEDVKEVLKGLLVKAHLDVADNPVAARVWKLLAARRMTEFSVGYGLGPGGERPA